MSGPMIKANKQIENNDFEQQSVLSPDTVEQSIEENPAMDNEEWEERLFLLNGNQRKLKHKPLEDNHGSTREFEFEDGSIKINDWIQVEPSRLNGEIWGNVEDKENNLTYVSKGGMADFTIPGAKSEKAQMMTINIVMPEEGESTVFFMLNEPVEVKFGKDFRVELEYGKYAKVDAASKGTMYFRDAKIYYKDKMIKECAQAECDEKGLRFNGQDTLRFEDWVVEEEEQKKEQQGEKGEEAGKNFRVTEAELFFDTKGVHFILPQSISLYINGEEVVLEYKKVENQISAKEFKFDKKEWELQKGFKIYLKETGGIVTERQNASQKEKIVSYNIWEGGRVSYKVPNLLREPERKASLGWLSLEAVANKEANINFAFKYNDPIQLTLSESDNSFFLFIKNGVYDGVGNEIRFQNSELYYQGKKYTDINELIGDESGIHLPEGLELNLKKEEFQKDVLSEEEWEDFSDEEAKLQLALKFDKDNIGLNTHKETIYRTVDGFGKIKNVTQEEEGQESGDLYLKNIPLILVDGKWNKRIPKKLKGNEEAIEGVTISDVKENGKIFTANKGEPISLTYEVMDLELEADSGTATYKKTITLENLEIKDGKLVVEKVSIEQEAGITRESEEEAKELFNCTVSGSIVQNSEWAEFTNQGLLMKEGKATLGTLSIEGFLGFLSGEVNYPEGSLHVNASSEKEAEMSPFFELEKEVALNIRLPIPGTAGLLKAKFGIEPSAKIGGSLDLTANRHKSFGEGWENGDKLSLGGEIGVQAEAGIGASAGLEAGITYVSNIDLLITASLMAQLSAQLGLYTKLMYQETEKANNKKKKQFTQVENLSFQGEIGGALVGEITLGSNAKFLFWKKKVFELELYNETLGEIKVAMEAEKDKDEKGLFSGWKLLNKEKFAKALGRSVNLNLNRIERQQILDKRRQEILDDAKKGADNAWAALMELENGEKDCLIIVSEEQKNALQQEMKRKKKEVASKIGKYKKLLKKEKIIKQKEIIENQSEIARQENIYNNALKDIHLPDEFREKALLGGMREEDYAKADIDMNSIDFIMYKVLGEVSEQNLNRILETKENKKWIRKWETDKLDSYTKEVEKEKMLHEGTRFGLKYNEEAVDGYKENASYYRILRSKVGDLKSKEDIQAENDIRKKMTKNLVAIVKLDAENKNKDNLLKNTEKKININSKKEKNLAQKTLLQKKNQELEKQIKNILGKKFPFVYSEIIEENPNMTIEELLRIAVTDKYKDKEIGANAMEKEQLMEVCFHSKFDSHGILVNDHAKEASHAWLKEMDDVVEERSGIENMTLKKLMKDAQKKKVYESIASSQIKKAQAEHRKKIAEENIQTIKDRITEIENYIADCISKLALLENFAVGALNHKNFNANTAKEAVRMYAEDYLGKIKPESEKMEEAASSGVV